MLAVGRLFRCLMQRISYICCQARHAVTCLAAFQWYHSMGAWGWATRHMQVLPAECVASGHAGCLGGQAVGGPNRRLQPCDGTT